MRKILDSSKPVKIGDFEVIREEILTRCKDKEREVSKVLKNFTAEAQRRREKPGK